MAKQTTKQPGLTFILEIMLQKTWFNLNDHANTVYSTTPNPFLTLKEHGMNLVCVKRVCTCKHVNGNAYTGPRGFLSPRRDKKRERKKQREKSSGCG